MTADLLPNALARAREHRLTVMDLFNAAGHLAANGDVAGVDTLYQTWIEHNADSPLACAVYFNHAVVLSGMGHYPRAGAALEQAIKVNPNFYPPYVNLGHVLERTGATGDAVLQWNALIERLDQVNGDNIVYKTAALKQVGRVLETAYFDAHAEDALRQGLEINAHQSDVVQHWVSLRQRQCKWPVIRPWSTITRKQLLNGISTLSLAAYSDDPLLQLANAYIYAKDDLGEPGVNFLSSHAKTVAQAHPTRRKIGYVSSDLREHAVGFLTAEIYGLHDRSKVEVFTYYCGIQSDDNIHRQIKGATDHWVDINGMSDEEAAARVAADGIEILVDLNGYTNGARGKMFSMCPAPLNVNWLGYPGSLGSPYHHYIIADDFIVPPGSEMFYSERVARLPCYQPNNRHRAIAETRPTRAEVGLPEDAMVYCCFNGIHKITKFTWSRWMSILRAVPDSVLWLLEGIDSTNARLKANAATHGIDPGRIVFAGKRRNSEHLARYPLADLFLDTSPYGAHTTSSDALWMGVPVLTLVGRSFASRVCGSLLKSANLEELICTTPEQFTAMAIGLGMNRRALANIRAKLAASRSSCVLFDTPLLVRSLENIYAAIWQEYLQGRTPRPDLTNLDIYNDIGIALDHDDVEMLVVPDYLDRYREKLREKDTYSYLAADRRLWPGGAPTLTPDATKRD